MRPLLNAFAAPLLLHPANLEMLWTIANGEGEGPAALEARLGRPLDNTRNVTVRNGIAIVRAFGPFTRHASMFSAVSQLTAMSTLATELQTAIDDPSIGAIILMIDSPGGEVDGVAAAAELITAGRARKPIAAHVGGMACSAAYWLATACGPIWCDSTSLLGSIGVVAVYMDDSARQAQSGVKRIEIVSSQSPAKHLSPATDEGRARMQATIDALAEVFIAAVAANRKVTAKTVTEKFGQGGVLVGGAAVAAGMADRVGTFEGLFAVMDQAYGKAPALRAPGAVPGVGGPMAREEGFHGFASVGEYLLNDGVPGSFLAKTGYGRRR